MGLKLVRIGDRKGRPYHIRLRFSRYWGVLWRYWPSLVGYMLRGKLLPFLWYNKRAHRVALFLTHKPNSGVSMLV